MTTPFETIQNLLTNLSNDRRRTVGTYANIVPVTGNSQTPQRLISDIGFLARAQFNYYNAPRAHYMINTDEDRRPINKLAIKPYGIDLDRNAIKTSRRTVDYSNPDYYAIKLAVPKTTTLFNRINDRRGGPAYHFVINRAGDVYVGPSLDFEVVTPIADSISIALESGVIIKKEHYRARNFQEMKELPFTNEQLFNLSVLIAKLKVIYPDVGVYSNMIYQFPDFNDVSKANFTEQDIITPLVTAQGNFDAVTEVFRQPTQTQISAGRSQARTALGQINTLGALSPLLGNYAAIASVERSGEVAFTQRRQMFVSRIQSAHREADNNAQAATTAGNTASISDDLTEVAAINTGPHTYDFTTGLWGDEASY